MTVSPTTRVRSASLAMFAATAIAVTLGTAPALGISQVDSVPVGDGPASIALSADGATAYVGNGASNSVSVIDLETQTSSVVAVGVDPIAVALRPGSVELWVVNYQDLFISIISTTTNQVIGTVTGLPASGNGIDFSADGSRAYVTSYNTDEVLIIDTANRTVLDTISVGDGPEDVRVDAERNRLVIAAQVAGTLSFVDLDTSAVTSVAVGSAPVGVHIDAARDRAYVTLFFGASLAVVDLTTDTLVDTVSIDSQPNAMAPSFDGRLLFIATNDDAYVYDLETDSIRSGWAISGSSNAIALSPRGDAVYTVTRSGDAVEVAQLEMDRIFGSDRYQTAIEISTAAYPSGPTPDLFIASGTSFPDALAIAPGVSALGGPLLLNPQSTLRADVLAEVERLNPDTVYIAGGTGVISATVAQQLQATGATVVRLSGPDRYETSREIVREFFTSPSGYTDLYLVTGRNFPDALSAGPAAGVNGMPMLLVDGSASALPAATLTLIDDLQPDRVILVGGTGVMTAGIQNQLTLLGGLTVVRAAGADRYATSAAVTELGFDGRTSVATYWATGSNFPDALAGITVATDDGAPLSLVRPECVPTAALHGAWRHGVDRIVILGGTGVVTPAVESFTRC